MQVTVALNKDEAARAARAGRPRDLRELIGNAGDARVLKIFGRGQFASVETTREGFAELRRRLGDVCVVTPKLKARPFGR